MNQARLTSLDAFRGLTIAAMILVNNPGSWQNVYPPLRHASWHGWTPTDLVFPFFLFIVGVSISFSMSRRIQQGSVTSAITFKILRRSILLFALGMFLRVFPFFSFQDLRIPGVLQRIAICYLCVALVFLHSGTKGRVGLTLILLVGYWAVMKYVPVPGYGPGVWEFEGNLCSYIDTRLLAGHLYKPTFDPEGILSTFPAIATTLLGTLTGDWLRSRMLHLTKMTGMMTAGGIFIASGLLLHPLFPINKQLWTSTYVLLTAGAALVILGLLYGITTASEAKKKVAS